jgi:hypothetical protein
MILSLQNSGWHCHGYFDIALLEREEVMGMLDIFNKLIKPPTIPANPDEWIILVSHEIKHDEDTHLSCWDPDKPVILEFVPIIAWKYGLTGLVPISPPSYHVAERLNTNCMNKKAKYQTFGFCNRDGAILDVSDMSHTDFWEDMFDYAEGYDIEIRGTIPDSYRPKFAELFEYQREHKKNKM